MPEGENSRLDAQWRRPARIMAWSSALAAAAIRHMSGESSIPDDPSLGFSTNFLWQSLGELPSKSASKSFEVSLIAQAEHGLHAAALAALTTISTGADLGSAVLAGMGALSGKKHGGANQDAFEMIDHPDSDEEAKTWVKSKLGVRHRFPGFGHRVYKTPDPRLKIIEPLAYDLLDQTDNIHLWTRYQIIKNQIELRLGSKGVFANIDAVTGLIYYPIGLPVQSFPIPFALAIQVGWMAHCLEYIPTGKMIEPGSVYVGK
jgi:citrate synthase